MFALFSGSVGVDLPARDKRVDHAVIDAVAIPRTRDITPFPLFTNIKSPIEKETTKPRRKIGMIPIMFGLCLLLYDIVIRSSGALWQWHPNGVDISPWKK